MNKAKYKKIQNTNLAVTKKLLKYISREMQKPSVIEELQFFHEDFFTHNIAFDLWLSFDFLDKDGNSFIDSYLNEYWDSLTSDEIRILEARNDSNISLFEVISIDDGYLVLKNLLENKEESVWEEDLAEVVGLGDLIFSRIANLLGLNTFVGSISYLPSSVKDEFIREIFVDFNNLRGVFPDLSMKLYLKNHSINLYTIYTNCVFEAMELEYDISSVFYDEIEEFQDYLSSKKKRYNSDRIISSLIDLFEYYLGDEDLSLYNLDQVDLNLFFHSAIKDGFIMSNEVLNSYITSLKIYLGFLNNKNKKYHNSYNSILEISKNRFQLMSLLSQVKLPFAIDERFYKAIKGEFSDFYSIPIIDFDKFILYIINTPLGLTKKSKKIKRVHLIEINNLLDLSEKVNKKAPNQSDFPLIDLYYNISLYLGLCEIKKGKFYSTAKGVTFLKLRDEEKFTLFFEYIWSKDFIDTIDGFQGEKTFGKYKKDLLEFLSSLEKNKKYEMLEVFPKASIDSDFFFHYYQYLRYMGIIDYSLYPSYEIVLTSLGKKTVNYLLSKNKPSTNGKIIEISSLRENKI